MTGPSETKQQVFVISPIGSPGSEPRIRADLFLKYIVREALPESEYDVVRADEEDSPYAITESMLGRILQADLCVADITGLNPNVMYELALAHAAAKKVIIMTADAGPVPFDIKDNRVVKYGLQVDEAQEAVKQLRDKAKHVPPQGSFEKMLNPVATAFQEWTQRQQINAVEAGPDKAILALLENLEQKVENLDNRTKESEKVKWRRRVGLASELLEPTQAHIDQVEAIKVRVVALAARIDASGSERQTEVDWALAYGEHLLVRMRSGYAIKRDEVDEWTARVEDLLGIAN